MAVITARHPLANRAGRGGSRTPDDDSGRRQSNWPNRRRGPSATSRRHSLLRGHKPFHQDFCCPVVTAHDHGLPEIAHGPRTIVASATIERNSETQELAHSLLEAHDLKW